MSYRSAKAAFLFFFFGILVNTAHEQERFYAPALSCLDANKQPPPTETWRTPVLVSPNKRHRAYAQTDANFDPLASPPCRTKAQLFVSSGKSSFQGVFVENTSTQDDPVVSLGPIAWSPNSRWLAVERAAGWYASDFGGLDLILYDSTTQKVITPNVLTAIAKSVRKRCILGYRSFRGFDAANRLVFQVADWQDDNGRQTYCINGTADWLFDPATGKVQSSRAHSRAKQQALTSSAGLNPSNPPLSR